MPIVDVNLQFQGALVVVEAQADESAFDSVDVSGKLAEVLPYSQFEFAGGDYCGGNWSGASPVRFGTYDLEGHFSGWSAWTALP